MKNPLVILIFLAGCPLFVMLFGIKSTLNTGLEEPINQLVDMSSDQKPKPKPNRINLHPSNLTVINLEQFQFLLNQDVCATSPISFLLLVKSATKNRLKREAIRSSWGRTQIPRESVVIVFLLGRPGDSSQQMAIKEEAEKYGDIVQGDFIDTYHALQYKSVMGLVWASTFCPQAEFVMKGDDDMFIDVFELLVLSRLNIKNQSRNHFLLCYVESHGSILYPPYRFQGGSVYPPYCSGWMYVTTPATAKRLANEAQGSSYFWVDDAWITGFLAKKLGIKHMELNIYRTMDPTTMINAKSRQSPAKYHKDYVWGKMFTNISVFNSLQKKAHWCFLNKCQNNIYGGEMEERLCY